VQGDKFIGGLELEINKWQQSLGSGLPFEYEEEKNIEDRVNSLRRTAEIWSQAGPLASFRRFRRTSSSTKRQAFCIASMRVPSL
jgi:hypothetical protein